MSRTESGVRSVQNALDILEAIVFSGQELGVTQLAGQLRLTKGSVHRHLHTLVDRGYLAQNMVSLRYGVGPKCHLLLSAKPERGVAQIAEGAMRELRDLLGHTVVLSAMTPRGALVLSMLPSTSQIEIGVRPGSELPFHASAQGKVLLAYAPKFTQQLILARPLPPSTAKTITSPEEIARELETIASDGFASAPEQALLGVNAVAAPIFDRNGSCIASIAVVGSIQYLAADDDPETILALTKTGRRISKEVGYRSTSTDSDQFNQSTAQKTIRRTDDCAGVERHQK